MCPRLTGNQALCGEPAEGSQVSSVLGPFMGAMGCIFAGFLYLRGVLCPDKQDSRSVEFLKATVVLYHLAAASLFQQLLL